MVDKNIEAYISKDNIKAQLIPFLMGGGLIHKDEDLVDIDFGTKGNDLIPITLRIKRFEKTGEEEAE